MLSNRISGSVIAAITSASKSVIVVVATVAVVAVGVIFL